VTRSVVYDAAALRELQKALRTSNAEFGLGDDLLRAVEDVEARIAAEPHTCPPIGRGEEFRQARVRDFSLIRARRVAAVVRARACVARRRRTQRSSAGQR
jgi:hypothetical protein